ncbi:Flp family type IVb pilin [Oxalobacteraceae bacterium]|nr:Flp family type IVb pilin [Oxalobacteraceae bacterium]
MKQFFAAAKAFSQDEDGITAIEYGLIAALMAAAIGVAFTFISTALTGKFTTIAGQISA